MNRLDSAAAEACHVNCFSIPAPTDEVTSPAVVQLALQDQDDRLRSAAESVLAALLLVVVFPVLVVAALLIKLTSRGPVVYTQSRIGWDGRRFTIYKLRTMWHNCEAASGIRWATKGDSRVTRVGKFLRATYIDELPQLINVIRGDMSLVGPRPERPEIVTKLVKAIPDYPRRHRIRPGVTGLAQIQLPADTDLDSVRRKLALDLLYIHRQTLWLDVRIMVGTLLKVVAVPSMRIRSILGLPSAPAYETVLSHPSLEVLSGTSDDTVVDHPILKATPRAS